MRKLFFVFVPLYLTILFIINSCKQTEYKKHIINTSKSGSSNYEIPQPNTLNEEEKTEGWILLFDGKSSNGWRGYNLDSFPSNEWAIDEETIHSLNQDHLNNNQQFDIITVQQYKNFELSVDWKTGFQASSGIYLLVRENQNSPIWKSAIKIPITDPFGTRDVRSGREENHDMRSLYDLLQINTINKTVKGTWNQIRIILFQGKVTIILNGEKVTEFQLWTKDWESIVNKSRYRGLPNIINPGGTDKKGFIGLQNNGTEVWFRNIKIKVIDK